MNQCRQILLVFFLTHIACLHLLWELRSYSSSLVFSFSGPSVEVLPSSTLWMVQSFLREGQPRYLSLWCDFCYIVLLRVVFLFSWDTLFYFLFHPRMFDGDCFQHSQVLVNFLFVDCSNFFLIWYFFPFRNWLFFVLIISMVYFSMPNFIPISVLYILVVCTRVSNSFSSSFFFSLEAKFSQFQLMVFHWSLPDSKSLQLSRTLLSISADLNSPVVWNVSILPQISSLPCLFTRPSGTVQSTPTTIRCIHYFHVLSSLARSKYLSIYSLSFIFSLQSVVTAKSTRWQVLFFFLINTKSGLLSGIW